MTLGDGVLAVTGSSGVGKSSVAAALALRGSPVFTDDVLAVELSAGRVLAHPGPAVLALREAEATALGPARLGRLGEATGAGGGKAYVSVPAHRGARPLTRLALLTRTGPSGRVAVRSPATATPRTLLGALFVPELRTPRRILGHLDLLAEMATCVAFVEVESGPGSTPDDVAQALLA